MTTIVMGAVNAQYIQNLFDIVGWPLWSLDSGVKLKKVMLNIDCSKVQRLVDKLSYRFY